MKATIRLEEDVAEAVRQLQRDAGIGVSEAMNRLARAGIAATTGVAPFVQPTADFGGPFKIDVSCIGEALDAAERARRDRPPG